jgi:hypothetical protein
MRFLPVFGSACLSVLVVRECSMFVSCLALLGAQVAYICTALLSNSSLQQSECDACCSVMPATRIIIGLVQILPFDAALSNGDGFNMGCRRIRRSSTMRGACIG